MASPPSVFVGTPTIPETLPSRVGSPEGGSLVDASQRVPVRFDEFQLPLQRKHLIP